MVSISVTSLPRRIPVAVLVSGFLVRVCDMAIALDNASALFKGSLTPIPTAVFVTLLEFLPTLVLLGRRSSQGLGNA